MKSPAFTSFAIALVLLGPLLMSCDDGPAGPEGAATVRVLLTDAPSDYVGEAYVDIGEVVVITAGDGPPFVLSEDGTDGEVDLLDLQNTATVMLGEGIVEPGTYKQIRLICLKLGYGIRCAQSVRLVHMYLGCLRHALDWIGGQFASPTCRPVRLSDHPHYIVGHCQG